MCMYGLEIWNCRTPVSDVFAGGYPSDEEWHGYINNNDRVLLKVYSQSLLW